MVSIAALTMGKRNLGPGESTTVSLQVYSDQADTATIDMHAFGLGLATWSHTTGPAAAKITTEANGQVAAWSVSFAGGGTVTLGGTLTASAEPFLWTGALVAVAAGSANTAQRALSYQVGRTVTVGGQALAQMPSTPLPVYAADGDIWLDQIISPVQAGVGAPFTVVCGPSIHVWGLNTTGTWAQMGWSSSVPITKVSDDFYGAGNSYQGYAGLVEQPGPIQATLTGGAVGIITVKYQVYPTPLAPQSYTPPTLGIQVGIGQAPPTVALPSGGTPGGGTPGGSGAAGSSWFSRNLWWMLVFGIPAAGYGVDALIQHKRRVGRYR